MFFEKLMDGYSDVLHYVAEITVNTLELIGIFIIIIGAVRALFHAISNYKKKLPTKIIIELGRSLALALEFKMGAEIIKTVIVHNLEELAILGVVVLLRALLAFIIHWEIHTEEHEKGLKKDNTETK